MARGEQHKIHSERAAWAWKKVEPLKDSPRGKDYAIHVRKLPARITTCGLGQTLAFLFSKSKGEKDPEKNSAAILLDHLGERIAWLVDPGGKKPSDRSDVMNMVLDMDPATYRRCTHELLATAEWLKRFAEGFFGKADGAQSTGSDA